MSDDAMLSRGATVELRQQTPREILEVLQAVAHARDIERSELVNEVLGQYAKKMVHLATVINNARRGNPPLSASLGEAAE